MQISIEKLIQLITAEVVKELKKQGVQVIGHSIENGTNKSNDSFRTKSEKIDMSKYKTPILTEQHIRKLDELTGEVIIPRGTIITPKAKELIKQKQIIIR